MARASRSRLLAPPIGESIQGIQAFRSPLDTKFAALYYPWIEVRDPSVGMNLSIAPSGHIAGIYARVDINRGVFRAPAHEEILSVTQFAQALNKRALDVLHL